ncbi:hypothetical protein V7799_17990 [Rhizobium laguerreae]
MEKATLRDEMKTTLYDVAVSSFGSTVPSLSCNAKVVGFLAQVYPDILA